MDSKTPHPQTLFHLVPYNPIARKALAANANERFVSKSSSGKLGLEVGYHVPSAPSGTVITRLGKCGDRADLILPEESPAHPMSRCHVAFEVNPDTRLVILSVRSKLQSSVKFAMPGAKKETLIVGDGVILYGQKYDISIAAYHFRLLWLNGSSDSLKDLVVQGYEASLELLKGVTSSQRPTGRDISEALSWHVTRLHTAKRSLFKDIPLLRDAIGEGVFGVVYKATDQESGHVFAIKVVKLEAYHDADVARSLIHREIKVMQKLKHVSDTLTDPQSLPHAHSLCI